MDFSVSNHGSILLLHPRSEAAKSWVEDNLPEDRQEWCGAVVVEPRYLDNIARGIVDDGLSIGGH